MSDKKETSQETLDQWNRIVDVFKKISVKKGQISILTGKNGSGKSFLRGQLISKVKKDLGKDAVLGHASMALRTGSNPSMGALSGMARDLPWLATSNSTLHTIRMVYNTLKNSNQDSYMVIDEPEIGCSEETELALSLWLNDLFAEWKPIGGVLIITHSKHIVKNIKFDKFYSLDGYTTVDEWLNRPIVPTNLDELEKPPLFDFIRDEILNKKE